jgi:hypothetical protein
MRGVKHSLAIDEGRVNDPNGHLFEDNTRNMSPLKMAKTKSTVSISKH